MKDTFGLDVINVMLIKPFLLEEIQFESCGVPILLLHAVPPRERRSDT